MTLDEALRVIGVFALERKLSGFRPTLQPSIRIGQVDIGISDINLSDPNRGLERRSKSRQFPFKRENTDDPERLIESHSKTDGHVSPSRDCLAELDHL